MTDIIPDYLLIGHIARDITPQGPQLGGTVSYAAYTAAAFGLRVAILTSAAPSEPLLRFLPPDVSVISVPSRHTTTFENLYTPDGRIQYMYYRAQTLTPDALPPAWQQARLIHLAPIAYEVDPAMVTAFNGSPVCVTPQGWMRRREPDGRVQTKEWTSAEQVLSQARLTVISEEDIRHDPGLEHVFARIAPLLIVTRGERGGTLYENGQPRSFPTPQVTQVEPTGAGDIFATALHIALDRLGHLDRAIQVAATLAATSVTRSGFASAPTPEEVARAWELCTGL